MPTPGRPPLTLAELESDMVLMGYTQAQIDAFAAWYAKALKKDPALTPQAGYLVWALGTGLQRGIGAEAGALGAVVNKGLPAAANAVPRVSNPLDFLRNIAAFFDRLGQASTWLRVAEILLGLGLITVGLAKLASGTAVGRAAARAGKAAALL